MNQWLEMEEGRNLSIEETLKFSYGIRGQKISLSVIIFTTKGKLAVRVLATSSELERNPIL
jgi:hypothetical protein